MLDVLLDKGLVIDAFVRVSLIGIELLTVDARVVIAGVDTYLHFAEAVNRLDLLQVGSGQTVGDMVGAGRPRSGSSSGSSGNNGSGGRANEQRELGNGDAQSAEQSSDEGQSDGRDSGGKGLLSRLADRGQAF